MNNANRLVKHYRNGKLQADDAIQEWGLNFRLGNIVKYVTRCEHKGSKSTDLMKAIWYAVKELTGDVKEADDIVTRLAVYLNVDIDKPSDRNES